MQEERRRVAAAIDQRRASSGSHNNAEADSGLLCFQVRKEWPRRRAEISRAGAGNGEGVSMFNVALHNLSLGIKVRMFFNM